MMKHFILSSLIFLYCMTVSAAINDVTLTTIGDGKTKQEAINHALKSALEQAYGAFMSSTTVVVNDLLEKDEIVSVSSGNIKSYRILGEISNGSVITVSCEVTVSLNKLLEFVQNTGAEVTFNGSSFAANVLLENLNKENERKVITQLVEQLRLINNICDYDIEMINPSLNDSYASGYCDVAIKVLLKYNANTINYGILLYNTLASLSVDDNNRKDLYNAPGLGNFKLRNRLPNSLAKDLQENECTQQQPSFMNRYPIKGLPMSRYNDYLFFSKIWDFDIYASMTNGNKTLVDKTNAMLSLTTIGNISPNARVYAPYACIPSVDKYNRFKSYNSIYPQDKPSDFNSHFGNSWRSLTRLDMMSANIPVFSSSKTKWSKELLKPFIYPHVDLGSQEGGGGDFYTNKYANIGDVFAIITIKQRLSIDEISKIVGFEVNTVKQDKKITDDSVMQSIYDDILK